MKDSDKFRSVEFLAEVEAVKVVANFLFKPKINGFGVILKQLPFWRKSTSSGYKLSASDLDSLVAQLLGHFVYRNFSFFYLPPSCLPNFDLALQKGRLHVNQHIHRQHGDLVPDTVITRVEEQALYNPRDRTSGWLWWPSVTWTIGQAVNLLSNFVQFQHGSLLSSNHGAWLTVSKVLPGPRSLISNQRAPLASKPKVLFCRLFTPPLMNWGSLPSPKEVPCGR